MRLSTPNIQLNEQGKLKHFLSIEGLKQSHLLEILEVAATFIDEETGSIKKVDDLHGKNIMNLFFEPSTRTLTTFEIAEKRLSADVVNLNIATSSTKKKP